MRYKATVSYDGTDFSGWQVQPGKRTVQEEIARAISRIANTETEITGAGRTDAGVHAIGQVFHFDCDRQFTDICRSINSQLPDDIFIRECVGVSDDFHARYDAKWKHYSYMVNTEKYDPLMRDHMYQLGIGLDIDRMHEASDLFIGHKDFTSFNATRLSEVENQERTIFRFDISERSGIVTFDVYGDGFLRHMVRMLVAALIEVGKGNVSRDQLEEMLLSRNKEACNYNIPGRGLYLVHIDYSDFVL